MQFYIISNPLYVGIRLRNGNRSLFSLQVGHPHIELFPKGKYSESD